MAEALLPAERPMRSAPASTKVHAVPAEATGVITIDLAQLRANWQSLARLVAPAECGAVVKADAYGLGADRVIPQLYRAGCRTFFVATPEEAEAALEMVNGGRVYVLNGLMPGTAGRLARCGARPVLSSREEVDEWVAHFAKKEKTGPLALHVDTGLHRLGMAPREAAELAGDAELLARLDLRLVMSHLVAADEPAHPKNQAQLRAFTTLLPMFPEAPASLAASDGLMLGPDYRFDLVRPGYALYGGQAFQGGPTPVAPVVKVKARVLQVTDVAARETIGYSATFMAYTPRRVAVIAAGYADGFARHLSATNSTAGGMVGYRGRFAPVVGRVSMDLITVDVTELADLGIARGHLVDLIGEGLTLEDMGARSGTIGYEVLTRLGRRFHRVYVGEEG